MYAYEVSILIKNRIAYLTKKLTEEELAQRLEELMWLDREVVKMGENNGKKEENNSRKKIHLN